MFKLQDAKYAIKVIRSVRSGYLFMEYNSREEWEPIGYTMEPMDGRGLYPTFELLNEPYYTCARFGNGRHIPLPLILGDAGDAGPLQRFALKIASKFSKAMREAEYDCAHYDNQWRNDYTQYYEKRASELEQQLNTDLLEFEALHCSKENGCDGCDYETAPDCPEMD